ncbi:MAG TPA: aminotransferase class V-fold PLP-dependent enzyme [Bryobacteraceae bacterium]|jgi:L-seryl-tRNA(Ser) seleniumtransferase|nr:aminotransferase class V-fold PLP-dependent enzyme [Bryobacteraceae bacterium]
MNELLNRRSLLKWAAALPALGSIAADSMLQKAQAAVTGNAGNIYSRIGVRPFINARGTWTYLSASLELPEVRAAKEEAAKHFVDIFELQRAAGRRLAELSGAESGMVTSGAAGAIASATAACIAGTDPAKIWQLPDTTGLKSEVIMFGGRSAFDSAARLAGAKLVVARTEEELRSALGPNTAMVYTTILGERLERALAIAKQAGVPLLLDDAAGIPPIGNLRLYAKMGIDMFCFSGGKGLCGPQCTGLLLGRKDLIEAALANTSPWEGAVCRAMKVGKEEVMGCLAAVEAWQKMDLDALNREWNQKVKRVAALVETVPGVTTGITIPKDGNRYPTLTVNWDEEAWGFTVADCDRELRAGTPRIEVLTASNPSLVTAVMEHHDRKTPRENKLQIVSMTLRPGEDLIVGRRLRAILNGARKKARG